MHPIALAMLCALLPALAAQGSDTTPSKPAQNDILSLIDQAEKLQKSGPSEAATRALRRAERILHRDPPGILRDNLRDTIVKLLTQADPAREVWEQAYAKAAAELIKTSQMYRRRKWTQVAGLLLADAEQLSPALAARERNRGAKPSRGNATSNSRRPTGPVDLTPKFRPSNAGDWLVKPDMISSPPPTRDGSHVLLGSIQSMQDSEISIEVKRPNTDSQAAILFGGHSYDEYFILDVVFYEGTECSATAFHWKSPHLKTLGTKNFHLTKEQRGDWLRYAVRMVDKRATILVGGKKIFSVECDRKPHGLIGMHVSGISKYSGPVHYRKISVIGLAEAAAKAPKTANASPLLKNISEAEKLIKAKKNEAATIILLNAALAAKALSNKTLRTTLTDTIKKLTRRADRSNARYLKSRKAAAASLMAAASTYSASKWFLVARDILTNAQSLDPTTVAAPLAKLNETIKALSKPKPKPVLAAAPANPGGVAKTGGLPAEPQREPKNLELLMMFEGGRQPYDKDAWRVTTEGIFAPVDRLGGTLLLGRDELGKRAKFSIQVKAGLKECIAGVALGFKTVHSYYFLTWWHKPKKATTYVQLYLVEGGSTKRVGPTKTFQYSDDARSKWMTLQVDYGEKKLKMKLGEAPAIEIPLTDLSLVGKIGLHATVLDTRQALVFRNLIVEKK